MPGEDDRGRPGLANGTADTGDLLASLAWSIGIALAFAALATRRFRTAAA